MVGSLHNKLFSFHTCDQGRDTNNKPSTHQNNTRTMSQPRRTHNEPGSLDGSIGGNSTDCVTWGRFRSSAAKLLARLIQRGPSHKGSGFKISFIRLLPWALDRTRLAFDRDLKVASQDFTTSRP